MPSHRSWADEVREEREFFDSLSIAELHGLLHARQYGKTHAIWLSITERSSLRISAWPLMEILERRSVHRSFRHHAAAALLRLMDSHAYSADALADEIDPEFDARLRAFRHEVMDQIRRQTQ
jgi:hypothetical protein